MTPRTPFPSLVVRRGELTARGAYAEAFAVYTNPDPASVLRLRERLSQSQVGIVAHFYMDPELQGVLASLPNVHISDSLVMAERALDMVKANVRAIIVLGVDFMAENVRTTLDAEGYGAIPVYRSTRDPVGCSLAEAADSASYRAFLARAAAVPRSLHVVYINTSLRAKAWAEAQLPTICCTSSNVVSTILAASRQIPDVEVFYGPDTYMGNNLQFLLETMAGRSPSEIAQLAPGHSRESLLSLVSRFHPYPSGHCVVHHLFGDSVARHVAEDYADAWWTAHLEVPGAMFRLALAAQEEGRGVVGSTSDILRFIERSVKAWADSGESLVKRLVLGTETGLVTSIVHRVQSILGEYPERELAVEIVFPVAEDAVTATSDPALPIVPGPAHGEGCSLEGGCATCPYMKQNSLDGLLALVDSLNDDPSTLSGYFPQVGSDTIEGRPMIPLARQTILAMRHFSRTGSLSDELVSAVHRPR